MWGQSKPSARPHLGLGQGSARIYITYCQEVIQVKTLSLLALITLLGVFSGHAAARSNPDTKFWGDLVVSVIEVQDRQGRPIRGAKVTIDLAEPRKAAEYVRRFGDIGRFPKTVTYDHQPVIFTHLAPSDLVGLYKARVNPRPLQSRRYSCVPEQKKLKKSRSQDRLHFEFNCAKYDASRPVKPSGTINSSDGEGITITR